jgi:hypothetical protein
MAIAPIMSKAEIIVLRILAPFWDRYLDGPGRERSRPNRTKAAQITC